VAQVFDTSESVNQLLRSVIAAIPARPRKGGTRKARRKQANKRMEPTARTVIVSSRCGSARIVDMAVTCQVSKPFPSSPSWVIVLSVCQRSFIDRSGGTAF